MFKLYQKLNDWKHLDIHCKHATRCDLVNKQASYVKSTYTTDGTEDRRLIMNKRT